MREPLEMSAAASKPTRDRKHRPSYSPKSPCPKCGEPKSAVSELCRQCAADKRRGPLSPIEVEFEKHLVGTGKRREKVLAHMGWVRRFTEYIGAETRLNRLTDDTVMSFFKQVPGGKRNKEYAASVIAQFLRFAAPRELVVVTSRESEIRPSAPVKDDSFAAVRQGWSIDKLKQQKEAGDDLIAKLGRKLIDHFVYFERRLSDPESPESIDELSRLSAECRELLQAHLPLFMSLSAGGRNVHTLIDERVK